MNTAIAQHIKLSKREQEVLLLIFEEQTTREIGDSLFISKSTVITHRRRLFVKLGCNNVVGLIKKALQYGYLSI